MTDRLKRKWNLCSAIREIIEHENSKLHELFGETTTLNDTAWNGENAKKLNSGILIGILKDLEPVSTVVLKELQIWSKKTNLLQYWLPLSSRATLRVGFEL